jgi:3alpha(or 20beta)-hydroxysteroid dehydrogenase
MNGTGSVTGESADTRLAGRTIVVTGAAQGQGHAEAQALARAGAIVVAVDLQAPEHRAVEGMGRIETLELDVTDQAAWRHLAQRLQADGQQLHGLVNNAGTTSRVRLDDVTLEDWDRVFSVNVTGAMLGMQTLLPLMAAGSSIVNVGSVAALTGHYTTAYTASKWALRGLSQSAAMELGARGIRVNTIHPGFVDTPMVAAAPPVFRESNIRLTPLGRVGEPADIAGVVVFLMSDDARFLSGADIPVDGGYTSGAAAKFLSDELKAATR